MPQATINSLLNGWLVVAVVLFVVIVWRTYRLSSRSETDRHARIPFDSEEGSDDIA
jgi:hypothetical protein